MNDNSYINWNKESDVSILKRIGEFIKHGRLNQNITQASLAKNAGISRSTLSLLENGESVNLISLVQVLRALKLLHILKIFEIEEVVSPLELAKKQRQKRRRASDGDNSESPSISW